MLLDCFAALAMTVGFELNGEASESYDLKGCLIATTHGQDI